MSDLPKLPLRVASDCRLDDTKPASIAVLIFDPVDGSRSAIVADIPPELVQRWSVHKQYIALVEQAAIVLGITEWATRLYKVMLYGEKIIAWS